MLLRSIGGSSCRRRCLLAASGSFDLANRSAPPAASDSSLARTPHWTLRLAGSATVGPANAEKPAPDPCGRAAQLFGQLQLCSATVSEGEKLYQCSNCAKTFRLVNALHHHIKTKHAGDAKVVVVGLDGKPLPAAAAAVSGGPQTGPTAKVVTATPSVAPTSGAQPGTAGAQSSGPSSSATPPSFPSSSSSSTTPSASSSSSSWAQAVGSPNSGSAGGVTDATLAPPPAASADGSATTDEDIERKAFTCTVCGKAFRLEAALAHHYQAKHGMEMPTAGAASGTGSTTTAGGQGSSDGEGTSSGGVDGTGVPGASGVGSSIASAKSDVDSLGGSSSGMQYFHAQDTAAPQPPQYHVEVAPNAPEESEIAAHARCVNHVLLVGTVHDIQRGFVFEEPCLQFMLCTLFENPSPGDPDRDFHTIRVFGERMANAASAVAVEGRRLAVQGRLRLVPQFETHSNKYYHFPVVHVVEAAGSVHDVSAATAAPPQAKVSSD